MWAAAKKARKEAARAEGSVVETVDGFRELKVGPELMR